ncbi:hypothetical protein AB835_00710 [Candidatus Endobugula sertula]|uniref:Uncharacterized protein n=1 Tax=Candidatus Endobugula sertula TaxID=62101 RepID=A0A1D2QU07_9GAMM|nr:hypothetical protein AB835_00710 [Candidatus Endobugula sertula]
MNIANLNYGYQTRRLALGIEFEDYLREAELVYPVRTEIEYQVPHHTPKPSRHYAFTQSGGIPKGLMRSAAGRYSLSYYPGIREQVDIRIYDYDRYFIPRRLRVPLRTLADVIEREEDDVLDYIEGHRRNVTLFPGAGYHLLSHVTGLRGRVLRNHLPMRWAYINASLEGSHEIIAQARGDDRGEFLLILPSESAPAVDLNASINIEVSISGPTVAPVPATDHLPEQDLLWDLPLEVLPAMGDVDNVSNGESLPAHYSTALPRTVQFIVGRLLTGRNEADFNFVLP